MGVLRRHHQERVGHRVGLAADRHVSLGHDLQQRGLHLGGCAVDLVGEQEVRDHRSEFGVELLTALAVDAGTDEVGGHQVGGELHPGERAADDPGEGLDRERLRDARDTFEEDVAAGQQAHENPLDELILTDDDTLDLVDGPLEQATSASLSTDESAPAAAGSPVAALSRECDSVNPCSCSSELCCSLVRPRRGETPPRVFVPA